eukprot:TRINITY_DN7261_c0_g1_i1.p1 TRINITY_DN7261_c0_g1~~TRINITY_DN7261_c0_g1_i1.p1  ORF type:complete len:578 (+),score=147.89 TRINITY_DN7261_c0_g1_i1:146-1879(+)
MDWLRQKLGGDAAEDESAGGGGPGGDKKKEKAPSRKGTAVTLDTPLKKAAGDGTLAVPDETPETSRVKSARGGGGGGGGEPRSARSYCASFLEEVIVVNEDEINQVSDETRTRVEATKFYIKEYYQRLFEHVQQRQRRREKLMMKLALAKTSLDAQELRKAEHNFYENAYLRIYRKKSRVKDYTLLTMLGRGGYGEVYLALKRSTSEILALKRMAKTRYLVRNESERVKRERDVMVEVVESPWLNDLKYSFQDQAYLYIAMEYFPGGDLDGLLDQAGILTVDQARFYMCEMLLAVNALHKLGYIHRDLKPGNFLVTRDGHLKLTDFGLSRDGISKKYNDTWKRMSMSVGDSYTPTKEVASPVRRGSRRSVERPSMWAKSIVGSPEYIAPEVLAGTGYDENVDWWSVGCIAYEMLMGETPFVADSVQDIFGNVLNFQEIIIPYDYTKEDDPYRDKEGDFDVIPPIVWHIITRLLAAPGDRLGTNGFKEIVDHPFFEKVEWMKLLEMEAPFVPEISSELDTSQFDLPEEGPGAEVADITRHVEQEMANLELVDEQGATFQGFTYKPPRALKRRSTANRR